MEVGIGIGGEAMRISHAESDRVNNERVDAARALENTDWDLTGVYLINVVCNSLLHSRH